MPKMKKTGRKTVNKTTRSPDATSSTDGQPACTETPRKRRRPNERAKEMIILQDDGVVDRWSTVSKEKGFTEDEDTARFLLSWYLDGKGAASNPKPQQGKGCGHCGGALVTYCPACNATSTSPSQPPASKKAASSAALLKRKVKLEATESLQAESDLSEFKVHFETVNHGDSNQRLFGSYVNVGSSGSVAVSHDDDDDDAEHFEGGNSADDLSGNTENQTAKPNSGKPKPTPTPKKLGTANFLCPFCPQEFPLQLGRKQFTDHMRDEHLDLVAVINTNCEYEKGKKYQCAACHATFKDFRDLTVHIGLYVGEDVCVECQEAIKFRCELRQHKRMHANEKNKYCQWCRESKRNLDKTAFLQHVEDHKANGAVEDGVLSDQHLDSVAGRKKGMNQRAVGKSSPLSSAAVDTKSGSSGSDVVHSVDKDGADHFEGGVSDDLAGNNEKPKPTPPTKRGTSDYLCPFCPKEFPLQLGRKRYSNHMKNEHLDLIVVREEGMYRCVACPRAFKEWNDFAVHIGLFVGEEVCVKCKEPIKFRCELRRHKSMHAQKKRFCKWCGESKRYLEKEAFLQHINDHLANEPDVDDVVRQIKMSAKKKVNRGIKRPKAEQNSEPLFRTPKRGTSDFLCPFCPQAFPLQGGRRAFKQHMKDHLDLVAVRENGMYRCVSCPRAFKEWNDFAVHIGLYVGEEVCLVCQEAINFRCELRRHKTMHLHERTRYCKWCQETKADLDKDAFLLHIQEHKANEPVADKTEVSVPSFMCSKCGDCFSRPSALNNHVIRMHTDTYNFQCDWPGCKREFKLKGNLTSHRYSHTDKKKEMCELCGKKFISRYYLKIHMQDHVGKKVQCQFCPKRWKSVSALKIHVDMVHKGIRRFPCSECDKKFSTRTSMKKHLSTVHSDAPAFKCEECGQALKSRTNLQRHMLRHNGGKPYTCYDCGVVFRYTDTLRDHRIAKHKNSVYACQGCDAKFPAPHSLGYHMKLCHNEVPFEVDKVVPVLVDPIEVEHANESAVAAVSLQTSESVIAATTLARNLDEDDDSFPSSGMTMRVTNFLY